MRINFFDLVLNMEKGAWSPLHIRKETFMPLCGWNSDMAAGLTRFVTGATQTYSEEIDMTWCGHNESMANGIDSFVGGLALQTMKRAEDEGVTPAEIPKIEVEEIDALLGALNASSKKGRLAGVMAIGQLIRFFYVRLEEELVRRPDQPVVDIFTREVNELNRLLFGMEEHYYKDLRPHHPRLEAIRLIRGFLESQV